jgi:hypothetical protein
MKTVVKIILGLVAAIFLYMQFFPPSDRSTQQASAVVITPSGPDVKQMVEVLSTDKVGTYSNYHFLILQPDSFSVDRAKYIAKRYCGENCNQLYYWKDKKAYELLMEKRSNFKSAATMGEEKSGRKRTGHTYARICLLTIPKVLS